MPRDSVSAPTRAARPNMTPLALLGLAIVPALLGVQAIQIPLPSQKYIQQQQQQQQQPQPHLDDFPSLLHSHSIGSAPAVNPEVLLGGNWNLSVGPEPDSTSHLVFDTVASLLQRWPNTRYRNGHNVVPGTVPPGTLMYHGRADKKVPTVPEWTAMDSDHSRLFCRAETPNCYLLTLVALRPLKLLYFDGSSAAKILGGAPMESQDLITWGEIRPEMTFAESQRIARLCEWGKKYDLDGFYRMGGDFEAMICDFSNGIELVSILDLPVDGKLWGAPTPGRHPTAPLKGTLKVVEAGGWHNFFPGELRFQMDLTRLVSFYDTETFPELIEGRAKVWDDRYAHRIGLDGANGTKVVDTYLRRLDEVLHDFAPGKADTTGSPVDWRVLFQVIMDRYADRLEILQYLLNATDPAAVNHSVNGTQIVGHVMFRLDMLVGAYSQYSVNPPSSSLGEGAAASTHEWASPIFQWCATTHARGALPFVSSFTRSEKLLFRALRDTNREICRVVVNIWAQGVGLGHSELKPRTAGAVGDDDVLNAALVGWKRDVDGLIRWLDWSVWIKCRPACSFEETCYMPTWPWFKKIVFPPRPPESGESEHYMGEEDEDEEDEEWKHPSPRCIRRMDPFLW